MGWLGKLFGRGKEEDAAVAQEQYASNDMRVSPVDNPLDVREDGSIREGDPAWDYMMEVLHGDGQPMIANQREDGTWETKKL